jgi:hypothetical protein
MAPAENEPTIKLACWKAPSLPSTAVRSSAGTKSAIDALTAAKYAALAPPAVARPKMRVAIVQPSAGGVPRATALSAGQRRSGSMRPYLWPLVRSRPHALIYTWEACLSESRPSQGFRRNSTTPLPAVQYEINFATAVISPAHSLCQTV